MSKNKKPPNKYVPKDLEGFEEVLDLVNGPVKAAYKKGGGSNNQKNPERSFELLNFLEVEATRLEKIGKALELKKSTNEQIQAIDKLVKRQEENLLKLKNNLLVQMENPNSSFSNNINNYLKKMKAFINN